MTAFLDFQYGTDQTTTYANQYKMVIEFIHLPTGHAVWFKAILTQWSDSFKSDYNRQDVYGRNDPIMTFRGTARSINLGWKVISDSVEDALDNIQRINLLTKFLYPSYEVSQLQGLNKLTDRTTETFNIGTLAKSPLIKVRFAGLINDPSPSNTVSDLNIYKDALLDQGLVCAMGGLEVGAELNDGGFDSIQPSRNVSGFVTTGIHDGVFLPKTFNLSTNLTVIHQHNLGWNRDKWMGPCAFPYNNYTQQAGDIGNECGIGGQVTTADDFSAIAGANSDVTEAELEALSEQGVGTTVDPIFNEDGSISHYEVSSEYLKELGELE